VLIRSKKERGEELLKVSKLNCKQGKAIDREGGAEEKKEKKIHWGR